MILWYSQWLKLILLPNTGWQSRTGRFWNKIYTKNLQTNKVLLTAEWISHSAIHDVYHVWNIMSSRWCPSCWMQFSTRFLISSITRSNIDWSIVMIYWLKAFFKSSKLRGLWAYTRLFKYPHRKKITNCWVLRLWWPRHISKIWYEFSLKHFAGSIHWSVGSMCRGTILLKPHIPWIYLYSAAFSKNRDQ